MSQDHIEYKQLSAKLPTAAIIFVAIIILGFVFMKHPNYEYRLSVEETLEEVIKLEDAMGPNQIVSIYLNNDSLYRFIDLRTPFEFAKDHIEGAINIPENNLLAEEYKEILNQDDRINILYHEDHIKACGPWMVLTQLGYKNNKVLKGGFVYFKAHLIDEFSPLNGKYKNEQALFDYAEVIKVTKGIQLSGSATSDTETKTATPVVKKKAKAEEEEGGC